MEGSNIQAKISLIVLDEIKLYSGFVVKKTVLTLSQSALFVCDNCISYSKSKDVLKI